MLTQFTCIPALARGVGGSGEKVSLTIASIHQPLLHRAPFVYRYIPWGGTLCYKRRASQTYYG